VTTEGIKVSALTGVEAALGTDEVPIVRAGASMRVALSAVAALAAGGNGDRLIAGGFVDDTGALIAGFGVSTTMRNGLGDFSIVLSDTPTTPVTFVGRTEAGFGNQDGPVVGSNVTVLLTDTTGAAQDSGFFFLVVELG
jgi:hypothetical protein